MTLSRPGPRKPGQLGAAVVWGGMAAGPGAVVLGAGDEEVFGGGGPTPGPIVVQIAAEAAGADEGPDQAGNQNSGEHRGASGAVGELARGGDGGDQREAQAGQNVDEEHQPHHAARDGRVDDPPGPEDPGGDHDDETEAIAPARAAEKHPPDDHRHAAGEAGQHAVGQGGGREDGDKKAGEPLEGHDEHAGPKPKRVGRGGRSAGCAAGGVHGVWGQSAPLHGRSSEVAQCARPIDGIRAGSDFAVKHPAGKSGEGAGGERPRPSSKNGIALPGTLCLMFRLFPKNP